MLDPDFWNDTEKSQQITRKRKNMLDSLENWQELNKLWLDIKELFSIISSDDDEYNQFIAEVQVFEEKLDKAELNFYLSGEDDPRDAILEIHSGAGGTDACDWAEMLLRMYIRWAEQNDFVSKIVDIQPGDEAGIKSAVVEITGNYAFGYLKSEIGVHRLVRISPFDTNKRRHTSFASVFVYPFRLEDDFEIEIDPGDLRIDTYRASGHGGQHINVTDSAVRITHIPSKIVVQCQSERSQHQNKQTAMKILRSRLYQQEKEKAERTKEQIHKSKRKIEWGSQIRSYVIHPYNMVKDHRTEKQVGDAQGVLDGNLNPFISSYLSEQNEI